jgi:hypothetical protein
MSDFFRVFFAVRVSYTYKILFYNQLLILAQKLLKKN